MKTENPKPTKRVTARPGKPQTVDAVLQAKHEAMWKKLDEGGYWEKLKDLK